MERGTYISREYLIIIFILIARLRVCCTQGTAPFILIRPLFLIIRLLSRILCQWLGLILFDRRLDSLVNLQGLERLYY